MSLKRSRSAPQPIVTLVAPSLARSQSHHYLQQPSPEKTGLRCPTPNAYRTDREDPFSLSGFFPSSFGALEEEEEWNWLREGEYRRVLEPSSTAEDSAAAASSLPSTPASVFGFVEDELTREAIKGEDKLGVLSLDTLFSVDERKIVADDRLFSPYVADDAVDHDSLHLALRRRREVGGLATKAGPCASFDALFLRDEKSEKAPNNIWASLLDNIM